MVEGQTEGDELDRPPVCLWHRLLQARGPERYVLPYPPSCLPQHPPPSLFHRPRAHSQQARGWAGGPAVAPGVEGRSASAAVLGGWERQAQESAQQRLEAEAGSAQIFYFEAQLVGGVSPVEGVTQVAVPAEMRAQVGCMEALDMQAFIEATGTRGCAIGVVEDSRSQLVHAAHMPLNSMVWLQQGSLGGGIRVPRAADGQASRLGALGLHDSPPDATLRLQSGDRLGVLVDYREGKIGFVRNGKFVHQLTQAFECRGLRKKQRKFQVYTSHAEELTVSIATMTVSLAVHVLYARA